MCEEVVSSAADVALASSVVVISHRADPFVSSLELVRYSLVEAAELFLALFCGFLAGTAADDIGR